MDITERIKKLWALSQNMGAYVEEAAAAAAKAQELCFQHNLELEAVIASGGAKKEVYEKFDYLMPETTRTDVGWKRILFGGICQANFCKAITLTGTTRMAVVGQKSNFEVVVYMFEYLTREVQRMAVAESKKQGFVATKEKRRYIQGFCEGAASTLYHRLVATVKQQAQQSSKGTELMVVKGRELGTATSQFFPHLRRTTRRATGSSAGYQHGREKGNSITVNPGVGGPSRKQIA